MKDSSVAPTGLFSPRRQRRLIDALVARYQTSQRQRQALIDQHAAQRAEEERQLADRRGGVTAECRRQRRVTLDQWDAAEEAVFATYEESTLRLRGDLSRLATLYRKKSAEAQQAIDRKAEARRLAVHQQYESRKHLPGEQNKKEVEKIHAALSPLDQTLQRTGELIVRRLDQLPPVPPSSSADEVPSEPAPESIAEAIEAIGRLSERFKDLAQDLHTGGVGRFVDSFHIPLGGVLVIACWSTAVILIRPEAFWVYLVSGAAATILIGFLVYIALLFPLRRQTRRLWPTLYRVDQRAREVAAVGKKLSASQAKAASEELLRHRDQQLSAANQWKADQLQQLQDKLAVEEDAARKELTEQLNQFGSDFFSRWRHVTSEMHGHAEQVAAGITERLADTDRSLQQQRESAACRRHEELARVTDRMRDGVRVGFNRMTSTEQACQRRFADWEQVARSPQTDQRNMDYVPLGHLRVSEHLFQQLVGDASPEAVWQSGASSSGNGSTKHLELPGNDVASAAPIFRAAEIPKRVPIALHRRLHSGMLIRVASGQMSQAVELVHQVMWRMLSGTSGGRTRLTLIDPIGRGQNFTAFMSLTDHDPALVGHRVWTTESQIEARLGEIAQHAEDVLQSSLRDQFERIEDYNQLAGSMAEPYQVVALIGLPEGLTRGGYKHLRALIESGLRCGVLVLMVCDEKHPWPSDQPMPNDERLLELSIDTEGHWKLDREGLDRLPFVPADNVPTDLRGQLVETIGKAATLAARVEVPLESMLPTTGGHDDTDEGIEIVIGSQGGHRTLSLALGEGVRQHVLIAGKTGSGKSTLLHSIITSGAFHYRPDQLQFYLLDFKKGVEFKAYADSRLPHARVIGIESEREFGRSVLQRLDEELQRRGEQFRLHSAQELAEYRHASGKSMPRILLVIDEFQELFVRDDKVAAECAMLLDRLVRQGRSFGIHVILSSQSLAGAYSLPRATLGQMAVRIAMQCSESDAALILSDENTAARLISRPGEAIYNDAGGLIEGNQPFQVAWLTGDDHRRLLGDIAQRDQAAISTLPPPVIFEGNRPGRWSPALASAAIGDDAQQTEQLHGLLGESVEIGPPTAVALSRHAGRNIVMIPPDEARPGILTAMLSGFAKCHPDLELVYFNGNRPSDASSLVPWFEQAGLRVREAKPRDATEEMANLAELVKQRGDEAENVAPIVVVIDPMDRFRDFRNEDSFSFSLDAAPTGMSGGQALQTVLKDGPPAHVYCVLVCGGVEILSRWLPRQSQHDVELRVVGRLNASDSSLLLDSPVASELSTATMLLYDEPEGRIRKFRQVDLPDADAVRAWLTS